MSVRTVIYRTDDISGVESEDVEAQSIRIPVIDEDGELAYQRVDFDGTPETLAAFVTALRKGIDTNRYLKNESVSVSPVGTNGTTTGDQSHIREWLRANGHKVADKGRIPADKLALYNEHLTESGTTMPVEATTDTV